MITAIHTTDRLADAHEDGSARRRRAADRRRANDLRPRRHSPQRTGLALATAIVALTLGAATPALAQTDTYTGGDKQVPGLVDGWFEPGTPQQPAYPVGSVR